MPHNTVILATRNQGKVKELAVLLAPLGLTVLGLDAFTQVDDIEETGSSFTENALLKARTVSMLTGYVCIADDSGIEVDALNGAPGVYSARYAQEPGQPQSDAANNAKLLAALYHVPDHKRTGRFCCAMAACPPDGRHIIAEGNWEGRVARSPSGTHGFGYDPVFIDNQSGLSVAALDPAEKNARSHRARAVAALINMWPAYWQSLNG